jgi:hypothetical protein
VFENVLKDGNDVSATTRRCVKDLYEVEDGVDIEGLLTH